LLSLAVQNSAVDFFNRVAARFVDLNWFLVRAASLATIECLLELGKSFLDLREPPDA
jgi:hypothetical protein